MKTIPTHLCDSVPGTDITPHRSVNPFANDRPGPGLRDLPMAAGLPTIHRHTNPMGCHRERRTRRGRRRLSRRRYRDIFRAHLSFNAPYDGAYNLEHIWYSVAALYERLQSTETSRYIFGCHIPPLQARPPAAKRESTTADSVAQEQRFARVSPTGKMLQAASAVGHIEHRHARRSIRFATALPVSRTSDASP